MMTWQQTIRQQDSGEGTASPQPSNFIEIAFVSTLLLVAALSASAQQGPVPQAGRLPASTTVRRDSRALEILEQSLQAQGVKAENLLKSVRASGTLERLDQSGKWVQATFSFSDSFASGSYEYRRVLQLPDHNEVAVSNHGKPLGYESHRADKQVPARVERGQLPNYLPALLLARADRNPKVDLWFIQGTLAEKGLYHIRTIEHASQLSQPQVIDWFIDSSTLLPARSVKRLPSPDTITFSTPETIAYSQYEPREGVLCPIRMTVSVFGREVSRLQFTSVLIDSQMDVHAFETVN